MEMDVPNSYKDPDSTQVDVPQSAPSLYHLPEWFLSGNIQTILDLQTPHHQEILCPCQDCRPFQDTKACPDKGTSGKWLPHDISSKLLDTVCATFATIAEGYDLFPHPCSILGLTSDNDTFDIDFATNIVAHLARILSSQLVSFDLEDWEDLQKDFCSQHIAQNGFKPEGHEEPASNAASTNSLFGRHLAIPARNSVPRPRSSTDARSPFDMKRAVSTIIKAANAKSGGQNMPATQTATVPISPEPRLIIHLRDNAIKSQIWDSDEEQKGIMRQVVKGFWLFMNSKQRQGQGISLILTSGNAAATQATLTGLYINPAAVIELPYRSLQTSPQPTDIFELRAKLNERRLRRSFKEVLLQQPYSGYICPTGILDIISREDKKAILGGMVWKPHQVTQAAVQMLGRAWRKKGLTLDDLQEILQRLCPLTQLDKGDIAQALRSAEQNADMNLQKNSSHDEHPLASSHVYQRETGTKAIEALKSRIEESCNEFEKRLFDGIIDAVDDEADEIESTLEEVIIDQDTKDILQCLIDTSRIQRLSTTTKLLKSSRIKGALLYGPPGTGKTHLARTLAGVSGSRMLIIDGSAILSKWIGHNEKGVKAAFTLARKLHPCVLFIDEVDSLFVRRHSDQRSWERSTVNMFLQQMDGFGNDEKAPFVLVATNRPRDLDEAFLRRLPQKILVGMPTVSAREQILKVLLKDENLDPDVDLNYLANKTDGYSGSDLQCVCEEAALFWIMKHSKTQLRDDNELDNEEVIRLGRVHFESALQNIKCTVSDSMLQTITPFAEKFGGDIRKLLGRPPKAKEADSAEKKGATSSERNQSQKKKGKLYKD